MAIQKRNLRGESGSRGHRGGRQSHHSNRILLDKFIKLTTVDSSLLCRAPFDLKVRGSYFDPSNNVDRDKNRQIMALIRTRGTQTENSSTNALKETPQPSGGPMQITDDIIEELEEAILATTLSAPSAPPKSSQASEDDPAKGSNPLFVVPPTNQKRDEKLVEDADKLRQLENSIIDTLHNDLKEKYRDEFAQKIDSDKREMAKKSWQADYSTTIDEVEVDDELDSEDEVDMESGGDDILEGLSGSLRAPLHALFYGKNNHRFDSYSIMNNKGQHQTHIYVTDASSAEEAGSMFGGGGPDMEAPSASFSLWVPRTGESGTPSEEKHPAVEPSNQQPENASQNTPKELLDDLISGFKVWVPNHMLAEDSNNLKAAFLVPTMMNKIFMEGTKSSNLELDGSLIDDLETVGLVTNLGSIKVKDLTAYQIRMASNVSDIYCQGVLDGNLMAELGHSGNFFATSLEGPSATVTTESGDIVVWSSCTSERSHFFTRNGNISVHSLSNQSYMSIKEAGDLEASLIDGSVSAVVRSGDITMDIEQLSDHSTLHVTEGNIKVMVPSRPTFRINATAPVTSVAPVLLNTGDMVVSAGDGYETFTTTGVESTSSTKTSDPTDGSSDGAKKPQKAKVISFHEKDPTLNMVTNKGKITIVVKAENSNGVVTTRRDLEDSSRT